MLLFIDLVPTVSSSSRLNDDFLVIPIIGIGGIGKTTLAKLVFNDPEVVGKFDLRLWAYVSNKYALKTVVGNIIQSALKTAKDFSSLNLETLQNMLRGILKDQTLLVLDDVWIDDRALWLELKQFLASTITGSTSCAIIVTAREESVAKVTGTIDPFRVNELPSEYCWSIFVRCAFEKNEEIAYPTLVKIGESIIKKCAGVPLAVKTLGTLLWNEREIDAWKKIEKSEIWKIVDKRNDIMPVLKLSFDNLPYYMRSCFAYCAIFGKGYPIYRSDLINLWMAQGFLQDQEGMDEMRFGDENFDELLSKTFFQFPGYAVIEKYAMDLAGVFSWHTDWRNLAESFENNKIVDVNTITKLFKDYRGKLFFVEMHDLFQDLAVYVAGEEIATISSSRCEISARARHIVWDKEDLSEKEFPKDVLKASKIRTFAFLHPMGSLSKSFLECLMSSFKCLRVLMLHKSEFEELPDLIGDLKHLRYINVSFNSKLKLLPDATCKVVNLQVLDLGECNNLEKLPKDIHRLVSLRSLIVTSKTTCLPERAFQCWSSLRILRIVKYPNLASLPESIGCLKGLRVFNIKMCSSLSSLPDEIKQLANLEELSIVHCRKLDLSGWKGLHGLHKLKCLRLYEIPMLADFPEGFEYIATSLQYLKIGCCDELRSLPESLQHCTSLLKFRLYSCGNLTALPRGIQELTALQELRIDGCSNLEIGDDWPLISHIPYVQINGQIIQNRAPSTQE